MKLCDCLLTQHLNLGWAPAYIHYISPNIPHFPPLLITLFAVCFSSSVFSLVVRKFYFPRQPLLALVLETLCCMSFLRPQSPVLYHNREAGIRKHVLNKPRLQCQTVHFRFF